MAVTLIVEDGTGVVGANTYNSLTEIRQYAEERGIILPTDDTELSILAIQATDYLETFREKYQGLKTNLSQDLQWPRSGVTLDGETLDENLLPALLKKAHCQATAEAVEADLQANPSASVKKEKVDVLEVEYADSAISSTGFTKVESLLNPLFRVSGRWPLRVQRA